MLPSDMRPHRLRWTASTLNGRVLLFSATLNLLLLGYLCWHNYNPHPHHFYDYKDSMYPLNLLYDPRRDPWVFKIPTLFDDSEVGSCHTCKQR